MRRTTTALALLLAGLAAAPARAQFGGFAMQPPGGFAMQPPEEGTFLIHTTADSIISGRITDETITVVTEDLGPLTIPVERISLVRPDGETAQVVTIGQSRISGRLDIETLHVDSEFGPVEIERSKLRQIVSSQGFAMFGPGTMAPGDMGTGMGGFGGMAGPGMRGIPGMRGMGGPGMMRGRVEGTAPAATEEAKGDPDEAPEPDAAPGDDETPDDEEAMEADEGSTREADDDDGSDDDDADDDSDDDDEGDADDDGGLAALPRAA